MGDYRLPHNAKGFAGDNFVVEFRRDKIVFVPKGGTDPGAHYTLHAGTRSGIIDLHETNPAAGADQHKTLFAVRHEDIVSHLGEATPMLSEFFKLIRPLRLGWLKRHKIGIARGVDPVSDDDVAAVTRKHKLHLVLDELLYQQSLFVPEFLEEVYDFPDGNFALFHRGRKIGIGFKKTDTNGQVHLFWIKHRDLLRFGNAWQKKLSDALARLAIPTERYADFWFLRARSVASADTARIAVRAHLDEPGGTACHSRVTRHGGAGAP